MDPRQDTDSPGDCSPDRQPEPSVARLPSRNRRATLLAVMLAAMAALGVAAASVGGLGVGRNECQSLARQEVAAQAPTPATLRTGWLCADGEPCARAWLFDGLFAHGQGDALVSAAEQLWAERAADRPRWLCLRSMGGSVDTARALAEWTRAKGLGTCVAPLAQATSAMDRAQPAGQPREASAESVADAHVDSTNTTAPSATPAAPGSLTAAAADRASCASACVEVWLAGQPRILHPEQRLGVHRSQVHASSACRWQNLGGLLDDTGQAYRQALAHGDWRLRWTLLRDGLRTPSLDATWLDGHALQTRGLLGAANTPATARWHATRP